MDAVVGLSVTPSAVGMVLVPAQGTENSHVETAGCEVGGSTPSISIETLNDIPTPEQVAAAVVRTEAIVAERGQRVQSIGLTWSDGADVEASLLLKSLSDSGFDNIVPVRLSEATDALARGIAEVTGYSTTAVCVIEPEHLIALVVQTDEGAVQTAVNHAVTTEEDLVGWLSAVFTMADWQPEALVLVGSAEDLDGLLPILEDALSVPVFSPAEAQLALARGAALACVRNEDFRFDDAGGDDASRNDAAGEGAARSGAARNDDGEAHRRSSAPRALRALAPVGPAAMLIAGAVTFVVSISAALALQATPERAVPQAGAAVGASAPMPDPAPAAPPTTTPVSAPGAAQVPDPNPEPIPQANPIVHDPIVANTILPRPEAAAESSPLDAPSAPFEAALPPVPDAALPAVSEEPAGIVQRIRERLSTVGDDALGDDQELPSVAPPPPGAPRVP